MSLLFVDSNCDLDKDYIKKLGVECINMPYSINDRKFELDDDFDYKKFYSKCKKGVIIDNTPLTSNEYMDIFSKCLDLGDDIVYVHSSGNIVDTSNLYSAKDTLVEMYPDRKIEFVDSANLSIGQGLLSIDLAMMYRRGDDIKDIAEAAIQKKNEYAMYFASGDCEQMQNRGLVDKSVLPGTMLNIKPIFTIDSEGKVDLVDKVSGKKKAILKLVEICRQYGENVVDYPISIVYTTDETSANDLMNKLKEHFGEDIQISINQMSPANVGVFGDKLLGIAFHVHKKLN